MLFFAKNLKFLRELKGVKQSDMLELCGFKQSTWNGYERGVSTPNIDDLIRISDFFKIPESDLLHTEIAEKNLQQLFRHYKKEILTPGDNEKMHNGGRNTSSGIVEEPAEEYGKPCPECVYMRKTILQKDETIAALHGQVAAMQIAIEALKAVLNEPANTRQAEKK